MLACLGLAGTALAADPAKKPDGFRGVAWGTDVSTLKDMTLVETDGDFADYDRTGDKKDLGGMPVEMVTYGFYKGQFYHAAIAYAGGTGFDAIQDQMVIKYGKPDVMTERTDDAGRAYVLAAWNWPGYAYIGHRRYKDGSAGRVFYFYSPLVEASKGAAASAVATAAMSPTAPGAGKGAPEKAVVRPGHDEKPGKAEPLERSAPAGAPAQTAASKTAAMPAASPGAEALSAPKTPPAAEAPSRPVAPEQAASGEGLVHTVEKGDMLSALAKRYGVDRADILAANPGINPTNLKLGQQVRIPAKAAARAEAPTTPEAPSVPVKSEAAPAQTAGLDAKPAAAPQPEPAKKAPAEAAEPAARTVPEPAAGQKKAAPGVHVIAQGDMISALVKRYGVTEKAILAANPGLKPGNLKLGAVIKLPHGATTGPIDASGASEIAVPAPAQRPEAAPEPKPEPAATPKPEPKPEARTAAAADPAPAPQPRPEPKAEPQKAEVAATSVGKPEPAAPATPEMTPEPVATAKPEPKAEAAQAPPPAPTPEAAPAPKVQAGGPREHVLEFDDTVLGLAKRYGVTAAAILKANPGLDPKKLKPGRKIKIP
jgi:LysM repeat protein